MSISLIGIISVQLYWSKNAIDSKDVQFGGDVKKALARVSERLQIKEQDLYYNKIQNFIETKRFLNKAQIKNFLILAPQHEKNIYKREFFSNEKQARLILQEIKKANLSGFIRKHP